ncbi:MULTISPECIES: MarR family winged helix-turn-helix transcriptional regulator [unclassified Pseudophaeobacter]|uniref:MarR family winged helix-turn-helix transcriptional regulator n=1 Tax=unclassified Pseudophaeobacter TaxID=2637024 RepID=UPI000EFAB1D8|nr:MarR family winged helix-turn-helix transcriptional regulator [Pseudophaeobacter sp. EL27]
MSEAPSLPDDMFLVTADGSPDDPAAPTLSLRNSPVVLVSFAGSRLTREATRAYQAEFGIGVMDWRMLVMLTRSPGCSVAEAARITGIDKAAVSRSLQRLEGNGLAQSQALGEDERRKSWSLTPKGQELHGRILPRALERQNGLLRGFSQDEIARFTDYLQRFLANIEPSD